MNLSRSISFFITVLFLFGCLPSFSQSDKDDAFYIYEDSTKKLSGEMAYQLYQQGKFTHTDKNKLNKGFTQSIFWLAYKNENQQAADSLLLYIGHHHINRIHFFFVKDGSVKQQYTTGDYFPFRQRPVKATGFYFPINKQGLYLAQIDKSNESLQLSFKLIPRIDAN